MMYDLKSPGFFVIIAASVLCSVARSTLTSGRCQDWGRVWACECFDDMLLLCTIVYGLSIKRTD